MFFSIRSHNALRDENALPADMQYKIYEVLVSVKEMLSDAEKAIDLYRSVGRWHLILTAIKQPRVTFNVVRTMRILETGLGPAIKILKDEVAESEGAFDRLCQVHPGLRESVTANVALYYQERP